MAIGKSFLDQYSVICVFGSVVGCVVVPLIAQSMESLILSAIVISLTATAKTFGRHMLPGAGETPARDDRRRTKERERDRDNAHLEKKLPRRKKQTHSPPPPISDPDEVRRQREEDIKKQEEQRSAERERRMEERREKKAKKKEERLKKKEEERKEKEQEDMKRRERQYAKAQKKQEKEAFFQQQQSKFSKQLSQINGLPKRSVHERSGSTSSTHSTGSGCGSKTSKSHARPVRTSSDSLLMSPPVSVTLTNGSTPYSPQTTRAWQPLPPVQAPPRWNPEEFKNNYGGPMERVVAPRHSQKHVHSGTTSTGYVTSTRSLNPFPSSSVNRDARIVPDPTGIRGNCYQNVNYTGYHNDRIKSQSCEALNHRPGTPLPHWVPGPASAPANIRLTGFEGKDSVHCNLSGPGGFNSSSDNVSQPERLYSLFSGGGGSLFSPTLVSPFDGNVHNDDGGNRLAAVAEQWK